jgi:hypothetical protein
MQFDSVYRKHLHKTNVKISNAVPKIIRNHPTGKLHQLSHEIIDLSQSVRVDQTQTEVYTQASYKGLHSVQPYDSKAEMNRQQTESSMLLDLLLGNNTAS